MSEIAVSSDDYRLRPIIVYKLHVTSCNFFLTPPLSLRVHQSQRRRQRRCIAVRGVYLRGPSPGRSRVGHRRGELHELGLHSRAVSDGIRWNPCRHYRPGRRFGVRRSSRVHWQGHSVGRSAVGRIDDRSGRVVRCLNFSQEVLTLLVALTWSSAAALDMRVNIRTTNITVANCG